VYPASGAQPYTGDGVSGLLVNSASMTEDGTELWPLGSVFSGTAWTKADVTVDPDSAIYRTINLSAAETTSTDYFVGKKWAALGTSITDQAYYFTPLETLLGVTGQNLGASGGSIASGAHYGSLYIYNEITNIDAASDLVTIGAGANDFGTGNSTLGALGDTTTATFYGALYASVVAIQAQAANALIVFLTPYGSDSRTAGYTALPSNTNAAGDTLLDFQNAVREVANLLGIPCIDVGGEAGFGYLSNTTWTSDGLHLNTLGGERYADYVKAKLDELAVARLI